MAIMARHMFDPVPRITTVRPTVAPHVTNAIERALAKHPSDRFASIADWRKAIRSSGDSASFTTTGATAQVPAIRKPPPTPATPLLGREAVVTTACERVHDGARVLTVTGVGGTGKTRLAIELFAVAAEYAAARRSSR